MLQPDDRDDFAIQSKFIKYSGALFASSLLLLLGTAGDVGAQDSTASSARTSVLDEVIVSARQREERLIDVPVAVTSLSAQELTRYSTADLETISELVPQMHVAIASGGTGITIVLRGISTGAVETGLEQSVAINVDGINVSRGRYAIQGFFDLERVEVLKGPQALFFGKSASAGVISLTSKGPGDELEGYVKAGYDFGKAREGIVEAAIGGPISDIFGARLAFRGKSMRGWIKDFAEPTFNPLWQPELSPTPGTLDPFYGEREIIGRLTLEYDPEGGFDATLKVTGNIYQDDGPTTALEPVDCGPDGMAESVAGGITIADPFLPDCILNGTTSHSHMPAAMAANWLGGKDGEIYGDFDSIFAGLTMNWTTDNYTITSVTGFTAYSRENSHAAGSSAHTPIFASQLTHYSQVSQELRFLSNFEGPINFMIGAYYLDLRLRHRRSIGIFWDPVDPATGNYQDQDSFDRTDGDNFSIFGQAIWDISDKVELAGGLRYSRDTKDSIIETTYVNPTGLSFILYQPVNTPFFDKYKDNDVSPEVTLSYHPSDDFMVYAAYKTGYKTGGFAITSLFFSFVDPSTFRYEKESSEGFEVGWKLVTMDNTLQVTGAVYHYIFSDLQVSAFNVETNGFELGNAAKATTTGVEMDAKWAATAELTLRATAAYNRARFEKFPGGPCFSGQTPETGCVAGVQNLTGRETQFAPKWDLSGGFTYDTAMGNGDLRLSFTSDVSYLSSFNVNQSLPPGLQQDGFAKVDASVRVYEEDGRWEFAVIGRNLTDKFTLVSGGSKTRSFAEFFARSSRPLEIWIQVIGRI